MFGKGKTPTVTSIETRIDNWADNIRKLEVDIRNRDENKEVALGTSKINYMDPRISVAWCKRACLTTAEARCNSVSFVCYIIAASIQDKDQIGRASCRERV